jgi:hypothetical protein
MNNTFIYLIGETPARRLAIAEAIAAATGARVVDSGAIYAPIFNVVDSSHPMDLPDAVWAGVDAVWNAVLATIETASPKDWSFVFTHAGYDIPADVGVYRTVRETAQRRGARFLPVTLASVPSKRALLKFEESDALAVADADAGRAAARIVAAAGG